MDANRHPTAAARSARPNLAAAAVIAALTLAILLPAYSFAAKGGNGGNPHQSNGTNKDPVTISVPDGVFAGTVVATVSSPGLTVHATCSQWGWTVYEQYVQTDGTGAATLTLGPTPLWPGGSASCTAEAGSWSSHGRWVVDATTDFAVSG